MPLYRNQAARVFALELAPSMLAQDTKPSRLERARYKLDDILTRSRDYQTALIGYGGDAFVAAPLTDDVETVKNLVDALDPSTMPVAGNAAGRAIDAAVALIEQAGVHRGEIILFADDAGHDAVNAARKAHARGFDVSVLGVGTAAGAPVALAQGDFLKDESGNVVMSHLDEPSLRAIATAGGGRYTALSADASDLAILLSGDVDIAARATQDTAGDANSARWRDRGPWLLLLLLPLALAGFRRGWLMLLALAFFAQTPRAQAASIESLWQRADQQAAAALADGDAKKAAAVAQSPEWHGSATYRDGDYETAAADYAKVAGAEGAYNRGNALAKLGRYEDALAAYDEALKVEPGMADALANRKSVEDFLKQKKQQDQQKQQQKQDGQQGQQGEQKEKSASNDEQKSEGQQQKQTQDGESGQGSQEQKSQASKDSSQDPQNADAESQQDEGKDKGKDSASGEPDSSAKAQGQPGDAGEQKPDAAQQKALSQEVDQALADKDKNPQADRDGKPRAGVAQEDDATREKRQALEHWLERVPDDPGGLLRRKFQLEYQRRQQRGGDGG
jgi:Ca-activated chloride channel family protein